MRLPAAGGAAREAAKGASTMRALVALLAVGCSYPEPAPLDGAGGSNTVPVIRGIESVPGTGEYRRVVTTRDRQTYAVLFEDPDIDQPHEVAWYVTPGDEPDETTRRALPIDYQLVGAGQMKLFVEVSDGVGVGRGGPYPITVRELAGHGIVMSAGQYQYSNDLAVDGFGALYTIGNLRDAGSLSPDGTQIVTAPQAGWLSKLDADERFVYGAVWRGDVVPYGVVVDRAQSVYLAGYYTGAIDLDPGPGVTLSPAAGSNGGLLVKLDRAGNYVWGRAWTATAGTYLSNVAVTADAIYAAGNFRGTGDLDPGPGTLMYATPNTNDAVSLLLKLDLDGNLVWARVLGEGASGFAYEVAIAADGTIVAAGGFTGIGDFDPGTTAHVLVAAPGSGTWVVALDAAGAYKWSFSLGGTEAMKRDLIDELAIGGDGSIVVTGYTQSPVVDFDPGAGSTTLTNQGAHDTFIAKYSSSGDFRWVRTIAGSQTDTGFVVSVADNGDVIAGGMFTGTVDLDPGAGMNPQTPPAPGSGATWLMRLTAEGTLRWASMLTSTQGVSVTGIALGSYLHVAGYANGSVDLDPGAGTSTFPVSIVGSFVDFIAADTGTWAPR